ncbi:MAG: outer membrane beta-barrel protein, partial [Ginsengibacter sp.]
LSVNNHIYLEYPNLKKIIFGNLRLADIQMRIASDLYLNNNEYRDKVLDLDTASNKYRLNSYLTNNRHLETVNILPSLTISKTFMKQLSNRYSKYISISAAGKSQHYKFQHSATQTIQNLSYHYNEFIPGVSASYNNNQYGAFDASMNLSYSKTVTFPEIYQLAPLIDSSNVLYIPMGNLNLIPQKNHTISLGYYYTSRKKNPLSLNINGSLGKANSFITDSTFYDDIGRRTSYFINLDGRRFLNMQGSIRKSYQKGKNHTYQVGLNTSFSFNKNPNYINHLYNISKVNNNNSTLNLDYAFKDLFALKLEQGLNLYNSVQEGFNNNKLNSQTISTMLSGSLQLPKNLNWSTNITFNQARANKVEAINFAIWNANLTYRFLQGNRGEVKFSALDMLHQNKAIVNSVSGNSPSFGYVNVLQQYFMITLSYFPRKFGR